MECVKNAEKKEEHHRAGMSDECNASIFFLWEGSRGREARYTDTGRYRKRGAERERRTGQFKYYFSAGIQQCGRSYPGTGNIHFPDREGSRNRILEDGRKRRQASSIGIEQCTGLQRGR